MAKSQEPVVLELAPLPREQVGPFLLLGLDKDAAPVQVEANWAERVKRGTKKKDRDILMDINWARDILKDPTRRLHADAASLNADTAEGVLRGLARRYSSPETGSLWQPLDVEKPLADYSPPTEVPEPAAILSGLSVPEVPEEVLMTAHLLDLLARQPLDPWSLQLPDDSRY